MLMVAGGQGTELRGEPRQGHFLVPLLPNAALLWKVV